MVFVDPPWGVFHDAMNGFLALEGQANLGNGRVDPLGGRSENVETVG